MNVWLYLIPAVILATMSIILVKYFVLYPKRYWLIILAIFADILVIMIYIKLFQSNVGVVYSMLKILAILAIIFSSVILFEEKIKPVQWLGIGLAVVALYCIQA